MKSSLSFKEKQVTQSGFALMTVLLALIIFSVSIMFIAKRNANGLKASAGFQQRTELEVLRVTILNNINCYETMTASYTSQELYQKSYGYRCQSASTNQVGRWLKLRRLTPSGPEPLFAIGDSADGTYAVGKFLVRATCSESENGLVVQAIPIPDRKIKLTGRVVNWDTKDSVVIGGLRDTHVCPYRPGPNLSCSGSACYDPSPKVSEPYGAGL